MEQRFNRFVDKTFWIMLLAIASYASLQLRTMSESIQNLNLKMAGVLVQVSGQADTVKDHELRIRELEKP